MRIVSRLFAAAAILAPAAALAADYDPPLVIEQDEPYLEEVVPVEIGSGWYLRGDISYAFGRHATGPFNFTTLRAPDMQYTTSALAGPGYNDSLNVGIGFGYRVNDWFRGDFTVDRFSTFASGQASRPDRCSDMAPAGTGCNHYFGATATGYSMMANAYVDLGTVARFTPYVGVGAGLTRLKWDSGDVDFECVPGVGACAGVTPPRSLEGKASYHLSYAAMAGVAFDINKNLKLDLGYRFRGVAGSAGTHGYSAEERAEGAVGTKVSAPGFFSHEVKVGLRYELW